MIMNKNGEQLEYNGRVFTIGKPIMATGESEYDGLFGVIYEIREGDDKDTDNETPDLYCRFDIPILSDDIQRLEKNFSDAYGEPKTLDDIILDNVIMAPDMVKHIHQDDETGVTRIIYIVEEDWAVEGDYGHCISLHTSYPDARFQMHELISEERENGIISRLKDDGDFVCDTYGDTYDAYIDSRYSEDHYRVSIDYEKLMVPQEFFDTEL